MQNTTRSRCLTILGLTLALATTGLAAGPAASVAKSSLWEYDFHSVVPLGADALRLEPAKKTVYLMASAESAEFEGLRRTERNNHVTVLDPNGQEARDFPQTIDFRVTVSAKKKKLSEEDLEPYPVRASGSVNDYLLKLGFRVKIFRGIEMRVLEPNEVKLIGVPSDVPYDERVYRVSFDVGKVPLTDRIVLEVLDPGGERVSKFHLEVY
jgi:hypothetical protein